MSNLKLILIEFNELSPTLLDKWMGEGLLPNFRRFYEDSAVFTTDAGERDPKFLEPWIQWYTTHTGLSFEEHKVFNLGDGPLADHQDIWGLLRESGLTTGSCSSMNVSGFTGEGGFYVADPWCTGEPAYPPELGLFQKFVSDRVQGYVDPSDKTSVTEAINFVWFLVNHGLRLKTIFNILGQLLKERMNHSGEVWKRPSILDKIQFDVFNYYYRKLQPNFVTFFTNSTAHYQHGYWRHMEPDLFENKPEPVEVERYKDAIFFGYQAMDAQLGDFFKLEKDTGATLVLVTALSQKAYFRFEATGGKNFYRPRDIDAFLKTLGVVPDSLEPLMTPLYMARFSNEAEAQKAIRALESLTYDGKPAIGVDYEGGNSVRFGNSVNTVVTEGAVLEGYGENKDIRFDDVFYHIDGVKSAAHDPNGALWFKSGRHLISDEQPGLVDIFPTIGDYFGVNGAESYGGSGRSLMTFIKGSSQNLYG